ncbi:hypothetical protein DFR58_11831 [Anaerobacterium chartisolvens]|uniref:DUF5050 domain-containing protein n=1 Tax=Anaerobacterium chartisolvens TaxID=1297424 RepID=A0A369AVW1_9FIRM|nr:hypothetical protein [Anaerobacterium chartisolvens]RCX13213.1 hypothetical protein DFR58_11831 [Anaerobacterium chartisolvens]
MKEVTKVLFVISISIILLCACSSNERSLGNGISKKVTKGDIVYYKVPLSKNSYDDIVALSADNIIFFSYETNTIRNYYKYNILNDSLADLGKLDAELSNYNSTVIGDNLFFSIVKSIEGQALSKLYRVGLKKNTLKEIRSDKLYQAFVYAEAMSDSIYFLKGDVKGDIGITYIEEFDTLDNTFKRLAEQQYRRSSESGNGIRHISCYGGKIYAVVSEHNGGTRNYKICEYGKDGKINKAVDINSVKDIIGQEQIDDFRIMGNYFFIKNFSNRAAICEINGDKVNRIIDSEYKLDIATDSTNKDQDYYLFYQRESNNKPILLDVKNNSIIYLDLGLDNTYNKLRFILSDDKYNILVSYMSKDGKEEEKYYLNLLDFINGADKEEIDKEKVLHME